ncbi:hypothetical protein B0J13DRAFT_195621 [Dactylonectria estremocensis]|uniref:Uncharacterized protein n=1 Tax=Dactylonectria estremocensis TaxID=1079267 RepID=A0A9P9DHW2_9HYPO|nr:hypothetical protein B0J13DRAFT_195621 [Dactylonectria estremocensis]
MMTYRRMRRCRKDLKTMDWPKSAGTTGIQAQTGHLSAMNVRIEMTTPHSVSTVRMTKLENLMKMRQSGRTNPQRLEIHRRLMYSLQSTRSIGIPWLIQAQKSGSAVRLAKNARFVSEERVVKPNLTLMRYNRGRHHSYYPQADLNFHVRNLPEPNQLVSCPKLYTVCLESTFSILPFHRLGRLSRHQETTEPSNRSYCLTVETPFVSQQLPSAKRLRQMFRE